MGNKGRNCSVAIQRFLPGSISPSFGDWDQSDKLQIRSKLPLFAQVSSVQAVWRPSSTAFTAKPYFANSGMKTLPCDRLVSR